MKRQILVSLLVCAFLAVFAGGQMAIAAEKIILWDVQTTGNLVPIIDNAATEFNAANKDVQIEVVHILNDEFTPKSYFTSKKTLQNRFNLLSLFELKAFYLQSITKGLDNV